MNHCKACGALYKPRINKLTKTEEDLCTECLLSARLAAWDMDDDGEDPNIIFDTLDMECEYD